MLEERPDLREKLAEQPDLTETRSAIAAFVRSSRGLWREEAAELTTGRASRVVQIVPLTGGSAELIERSPQDGEAGKRLTVCSRNSSPLTCTSLIFLNYLTGDPLTDLANPAQVRAVCRGSRGAAA